MKKSDSKPRDVDVGKKTPVRVWFTPTIGQPGRPGPGGGIRDQHHGGVQPVPLALPLSPSASNGTGFQDTDTWQNGYLKPGSVALREIDFWVGV